MSIQIWLHKLSQKRATREQQSGAARRLLDIACRLNGVTLTPLQLNLPGLQLMEIASAEHGIALSITHTRQRVAVALSPNSLALGLDCEPLGRARNWQGIADSFFTVEEANTIRQAGPAARELLFLRHWVLKESYIKATRGSLFGGLNKLVLTSQHGQQKFKAATQFDAPWWGWEGSFANCALGVMSCNRSMPALEFYESANPADGSHYRCDDRFTGGPVTAV